mgnify:CR=1 FL=1
MSDSHGFACIGHRGASGYEPENTLRSFSRAIEMKCSWIELDVHMADGHIMVIHDEDLSRTTNGKGKISESKYEYLSKLDAGEGEHIPTLPEVLALVDHRCRINIELKGEAIAEPVCAVLRESSWAPDEFLISSFNHEELTQVDAFFTRGALFDHRVDSYVDTAKRLNAEVVILTRRLVTRKVVDQAHNNGLKFLVYTVNKPGEVRKMKSLGVDGIFTDFPDRAMKIASEP